MFSSQSHLPSSLSPCPQLKKKKKEKRGKKGECDFYITEECHSKKKLFPHNCRTLEQPVLVTSVYKIKILTPFQFQWGCFCCLWLCQTASEKVLQKDDCVKFLKCLYDERIVMGAPFFFYFQHVNVVITANLLQWLTVLMWMCLHRELQVDLKIAKDLNNTDSEYQHFPLSAAGSDPSNSPHTSQSAGGSKTGHKSLCALVAWHTHYEHRMHQTDDTICG